MWTLATWFIQTATVSGTTVSFTPFPSVGNEVADVLVAMSTAASCALLGKHDDGRLTHVGAACVKAAENSVNTSVLMATTTTGNQTMMAWNVDPAAATATHAGIAILKGVGVPVPLATCASFLQTVTICPGAMCDSTIRDRDIVGPIVPPPPVPRTPTPEPTPEPTPVATPPSFLLDLRRKRLGKAKNHLERLSIQSLPLYDHPEWLGAWVIPEGSLNDDGVYVPNPESVKPYNVLLAVRVVAVLIGSIATVGTLSARLKVVESILAKLGANTSLGAFRAGFSLALIVHIEWILARAVNPGKPERRSAALSAWRTAVECIVMFMCTQAAERGVSTPALPPADASGSPDRRLYTHVTTSDDGGKKTWTIKPWTLAPSVLSERRGVLRAGELTVAMNAHVTDTTTSRPETWLDGVHVSSTETWLDAVRVSSTEDIPGGRLSDISDAMQRANMLWLDTLIACARAKTADGGSVHVATEMAVECRDTYDTLVCLSSKVLFTEGCRLSVPDADVDHSGEYGGARMTFPVYASRAPPCVLSTLLRAHAGAHPQYEARKFLVMEAGRGNVASRAPSDRHALGMIDFLDAAIERETRGGTTKLDAGMVGSIAKLSMGPPKKRRGNSCGTVQRIQRVSGRPGCGVVCPFMNPGEKRVNPFDVADALAKAIPGAELEWPSVHAFTRKEWEDGVGASLQSAGMGPVELCRNTVFAHDPIRTKSAFPRDIPIVITKDQM